MRRWTSRFRENRPVVYHATIPRGPAGTSWTVRYVAGLIRAGAKDPFIRRVAVRVFRSFGVPPKDYGGEVKALFEWVRGAVRYTRDTFRVELLQTPRRTLVERAGDCDDMTILLGALLEATGHPIRLVIVGFDARHPDRYSHIYLETQLGPAWIPLDATMSWPMGSAPPAKTKKVIELPRGRNMWIGGAQVDDGWGAYGDYDGLSVPFRRPWPSRFRRPRARTSGWRQRLLRRRLAILRQRLRRQRRRRRYPRQPIYPVIQPPPFTQPMPYYYQPQPLEPEDPSSAEPEEMEPTEPSSQAPPASPNVAGWVHGWGAYGVGDGGLYGWPIAENPGFPPPPAVGYPRFGVLPAAAALAPAILPIARRVAPHLIRRAAPFIRRLVRGRARRPAMRTPAPLPPYGPAGAILHRRMARIERLLREVLRRHALTAAAAPPSPEPAATPSPTGPAPAGPAEAAPQVGFYW